MCVGLGRYMGGNMPSMMGWWAHSAWVLVYVPVWGARLRPVRMRTCVLDRGVYSGVWGVYGDIQLIYTIFQG